MQKYLSLLETATALGYNLQIHYFKDATGRIQKGLFNVKGK